MLEEAESSGKVIGSVGEAGVYEQDLISVGLYVAS